MSNLHQEDGVHLQLIIIQLKVQDGVVPQQQLKIQEDGNHQTIHLKWTLQKKHQHGVTKQQQNRIVVVGEIMKHPQTLEMEDGVALEQPQIPQMMEEVGEELLKPTKKLEEKDGEVMNLPKKQVVVGATHQPTIMVALLLGEEVVENHLPGEEEEITKKEEEVQYFIFIFF
jgi:hypothetical protein